ncbi:unnamed protein product [Hermetia illucens]|uniref:Cell growth-regulating nucleolar protein n=1 Tax=Hermetia illucens TaxID=343691 RepID=A0A7R8YLM4_HERIL|nr:cell growth-regulating nucleolar protein [Hermetia illucens]CAD7077688.1 unnamed protein product [Hermetia illucens]
MVFFTCNHCGESAKKPAVAKHYQFKCRNVEIFVSCMDCQKDFRGQEYVAHTSCISEAEKYSGKDYVPKASKNTGQKKQESWIEIVRSVLSGGDVNVSTQNRRLLQRLLEFDNVPRKKPKFVNFVVNSLRINKPDALAVWEVIEPALDKFKATRPGAQKAENEQKSDEKVADGDCNGTEAKPEINGSETEGKSEKKKRKKRDSDEPANGVEESAPVSNDVDPESASPKKKKKKSKHPADDQENTPHNGHVAENGTSPTDDTETPKKKSKKRSKEADEETSVTTTSQETNETNGYLSPKKKKKKTSESEQNTGDSTNGGLDETVPGPPGKFDWTNEIFNVVEKNNNEIDLEKLRKKVLKKYQKLYQVDEIPWKVQKTFNKKLKKSGLKVEGNLVKTSI